MIKNLYLTMLCAFLIVNVSQAASSSTISVRPGTKTSNKALVEALEKASQSEGGPITLNMELGTYYFSYDESEKQLYYVSNTTTESENPDQTKHIGLLLKDLKNVTIDGNGSTIVMTGKMTSFVIDGCENITFKNMNFDYLQPTQTEIKVLEKGNDYLVVSVHSTSQYRVKDGKLEWYGDGWSFSGGIAQAYDYQKDITWRTWSPMSDLIRTEELGKNKLKMYYSKTPEAEVGLVYQLRDAIRDEVCGLVQKSKNVSFDNVNFYYLGNFGIVCQYSENMTFDNVNFEPEPGSGRTNAGFADFIQVSGCKGLIDVKNCRFTGAHDDPINVHGTHLEVKEFLSGNKVRVRFMHGQSFGFDAFFKDDVIEFIDNQSLLSLDSARVVSAEVVSPREIILTLDREMGYSIQVHSDLVVENVTWTPEVIIAHNYFSRIPTRGILVTTRRKVLIEDNTFFRMQMSGILIADDARSWYESGMVKDVTIRNNYFIECGEPVINIAPENNVNNGFVHRNITIQNNKFKLRNATLPAIYAKSVDGLNILNNLYIIDATSESKENFLEAKDCRDVLIRGNKVERRSSDID